MAGELAAATKTNPGALQRALRFLSIHGVFEKRGDAYVHNAASRILRTDHPQSMRAFVRMQHIRALWRMCCMQRTRSRRGVLPRN
jgi:hypothetical protein